MRNLFVALVCLAGCSKNGSLVFVTVDSIAPIADAARMHVTLTDGATHSTDVTLSPATFPPTHSFAVDVGAGVGGTMNVQIEVFDSTGASAGSAEGSVAIVAGGRADLTLTIGGGSGQDLSIVSDLAMADLTGAPPPDMAWRTLAWTPKQIGSAQMFALWASDATHIWVCGDSTANCYFSAGDDVWPQKSANPFYTPGGIWGTSSTVLFFVGNNSDIRNWDSTAMAWNTAPSSIPGSKTLTAIWGTSVNDIYVTANHDSADAAGEFIYHNTTGNIASGWTNPWAVGAGGLNGVSGTTGHTYVVGNTGRVLHSSDGTSWNTLTTGVPAVDLHGVFVLDAQHVYVVGDAGTILFAPGNGIFTKQTIAATYATFAFRAVWAADADNVFAVGDKGAVLHGDSAGVWTAETSGLEVQAVNINAIWGTSATNVYVASDGGWVSHGK